LTIEDREWWPSILWPLCRDFGPRRVRAAGEVILGFPPDVFDVTYNEFRTLSDFLNNTTRSSENGNA